MVALADDGDVWHSPRSGSQKPIDVDPIARDEEIDVEDEPHEGVESPERKGYRRQAGVAKLCDWGSLFGDRQSGGQCVLLKGLETKGHGSGTRERGLWRMSISMCHDQPHAGLGARIGG